MTEVVVLGLGYIGLPTAALLASRGVSTLGVDINPEVVEKVSQGKIHIFEPDLEQMVREAVCNGNLSVANKPQPASVYLVVVPTPFKENHQPDISFVQDAIQSILPLLKEDDLIIIESTSPIGTTEKMKNFVYKALPKLEGKIKFAYCPERVLPGKIIEELLYNDRVIGGIDKGSTQKAVDFYRKFVKGKLHTTDAKTAEMCKLTENASRDVEIAFANELSLICDAAGIDVWELIKLANHHPRVNILQPGCGVGGHCIAVDPYFLMSDFPIESQLIGKAREINNYKSLWCAEQIKKAQQDFTIQYGRPPSVALLGLAFKPNIDDLRESPAKFIVQTVLQNAQDEDYYIVEPNLKTHKIFKLTNYAEAIEKADILAFLVAHKEFKLEDIPQGKKVLDFCGITSTKKE